MVVVSPEKPSFAQIELPKSRVSSSSISTSGGPQAVQLVPKESSPPQESIDTQSSKNRRRKLKKLWSEASRVGSAVCLRALLLSNRPIHSPLPPPELPAPGLPRGGSGGPAGGGSASISLSLSSLSSKAEHVF